MEQPKTGKPDTTSQTHILFLDMLEVEDTHNVEVVVNPAEKCSANPVLPLGDVGEWDFRRTSNWGGTTIFDEDEKIFKMWYIGQGVENDDFAGIGYAVSQDGIYWQKPRLGLYEYRGSKENNIVFQSPTGIKIYGVVMDGMCDHFTLTRDAREEDAAKRYKGWTRIYYEQEDTNVFFPMYSADGIHWEVGSAPVAYPTIDPTNVIVDDEDPDPGKRIKFYGNLHDPDRRIGHRDMGYGPDFEQCAPSPHNPVLEPVEGMEHTIHLFTAIRYRGYYVMLYNYNLWLDYYGQRGDFDVRKEDPRVPEPKTGAFVGDIRLAVNRDGVGKFRRVNMHQPVVARGEKGEWDSASLVTSAPIVHGDTIYIFYSAVDESGGASPNAWLENIPCPIRTGLATLRLDGFTCLQSRDRLTPATVTTVPISVKGPKETKLILNASDFVPYRDWIEVEVLDAGTGSPVAGYGREDCTDVVREGIRIPVAWRERQTLEGVTSEEVQLRFTLYGKVRLYSFTFTS